MHIYAAIDPMALILPTAAYLRYVELKHPNEPAIAALTETLKHMSAEERKFMVANAKRVAEYAQAAQQMAH